MHCGCNFCSWGVSGGVKVKSLSRVRLFVTPWTVAYQASPSMGFSRQEYWSGLPFPSPGRLPDTGIKPGSPALEADALTSEPPGKPVKRGKFPPLFLLNSCGWSNKNIGTRQIKRRKKKNKNQQPHFNPWVWRSHRNDQSRQFLYFLKQRNKFVRNWLG